MLGFSISTTILMILRRWQQLLIPPQYPLWGDFDALKDDMTRIRLTIDTQYIDASFPVSLSWVRRGNVIYDPLAPEAWQIFDERRKPTSSQFWRIHGWHPERWVRLYSQKQIEHLAKSIIDFRPKFVTLAHSQRHQQWSELEQVLAALSKIWLKCHHLRWARSDLSANRANNSTNSAGVVGNMIVTPRSKKRDSMAILHWSKLPNVVSYSFENKWNSAAKAWYYIPCSPSRVGMALRYFRKFLEAVKK